MKKVIGIFLSVVLMISVLPLGLFSIAASAETTYTEGYYSYTVSNGEATITACDGNVSGDVIIPSTLGGYPVTKIGYGAFSACFRTLSNVTLSNSITSIGDAAFVSCYALKSINIPSSVTSIGNSTFSDCCALTEITIHQNIVNIGNDAFWGCSSLEYIRIYSSVTNIGDKAFEYCSSLIDVDYIGSYEQAKNIKIGSDNTCLTEATWHYIEKQDLNGDGEVNLLDLVKLKKILAGYEETYIVSPDLDDDGDVTAKDLTILMEFILADFKK